MVPIPDTSRPAAMAVAEELKLPYREGFIKNRYSGRTFIMGSQAKREYELRLKLNPIRPEFEGRDVLLIDDSIVRGTTLAHTVDLVRRQGATSVHLGIYSPPVLFPWLLRDRHVHERGARCAQSRAESTGRWSERRGAA